jgi:endo-1,4-beta-xylanase
MKLKAGVCLFSVLFLGFVFFGCTTEDSDSPPEYDDDIILHTKWPFPVGVSVPGAATNNNSSLASDNNALRTSSRQHQFLKHFRVVVAENEMKPNAMLPTSEGGAYRWTNADALISYAKENGMGIRGHTLFWHDQTPTWFFRGSGTGGRATKAELYARMENYTKAVFEKYRGDVGWWDVCNEVVDHDVYTNGGARINSEYTKIMEDSGLTGINRYEYVLKAFQWARQYANANGGTNVKLYLTDYGIERPFAGSTSGSKQEAFEGLVDYLIRNNAPIDGVGFQSHFRLYDHPVSQISQGIDKFAAKTRGGTRLKVQICELDISIFSSAKGESAATTMGRNVLNQRLSDLANTYREFFDMFEQKYNEGKLDMVVVWGIADGHSWLNNHPVSGRTDHPLLFNRNYRGKEAYNKLVTNRD